jgi:methionyl-tRNA synthetase
MSSEVTPAYITTPIYYPNDIPHLGTAYPTLAADILARWHRLRGRETFFLTGTDEHGRKIENAALKRGVSPKQLVDELSAAFKTTFGKLRISYDRFIRTTDEDHGRVVREFLERVRRRGDIYEGVYEGLYCVECESYYTAGDLTGGCCPLHLRPPEILKEDCYYFRLSKYRTWLLEHYREHPDFIMPASRYNEVVRFVAGGLEDLCVSRSTFSWGIPMPFDERHIAYVWFDALINYITGVNFLDRPGDFEKFWPSATHIVGKDILRFHAVIWPAMLRSAGVAPPKKVFAHGFWTVNGRKFSKSLGNALVPDYLIEKYGLGPLRYYMFRAFPFGADGDFSEAHLVERNNSELAKGLGNLLQRTTAMITKYCGGVIPRHSAAAEMEDELARAASLSVSEVSSAFDGLAFSKALDSLWEFIRQLNVYINARKPWALARAGERLLLETTLAHAAEGLRFLSTLIVPFMPGSGEAIAERLGLGEVPSVASLVWGSTLAGARVRQGQPLFGMLEAPGRSLSSEGGA